ncbi:unnamed protein product, partial [Oppiella nova]
MYLSLGGRLLSRQCLQPLVVSAAPGVRSVHTFDNQKFGKNIVLIDGIRTPFNHSNTDYKDLMAYE